MSILLDLSEKLFSPGSRPPMRTYGEPNQPPRRPSPPPPPVQSLAEARETLQRLQTAAEPIEARFKEWPELARPPELFTSDSAKNFRDRQGEDACQAVSEAAAHEPLTCLSFGDFGRTFRALLGDPRGQVVGDYQGALQIVGRQVATLEAAERSDAYEAVAQKLHAADAKIAKALLAFRDAWQARVELAQSAPRPANFSTRPAIRVTSDLNQLIASLRGAKSAEDLLF